MSKTVFNQRDIDFTKQPMFFGEDGGVQRYDEFKYPQFDKLNQTMIGYFLETRRSFITERQGRLPELQA